MRRRDNGEGSWFRVPNKKNGKTVSYRWRLQKRYVSIPLQVNTNAKTPVLCAYFNPLTAILA